MYVLMITFVGLFIYLNFVQSKQNLPTEFPITNDNLTTMLQLQLSFSLSSEGY